MKLAGIIATTVSVFALAACVADTAEAADVNSEISLDFSENAAGNVVATKSFDIDVTGAAGGVAIGLATDDNNNVVLDSYAIGTEIEGFALTFGDQGDLMGAFEGQTEAVGGQTLTDLDDEYESIQVRYKEYGLMLGFNDVGSDVTEVDNVQVSAGTEIGVLSLNAAVNWEEATEEFSFAGSAGLDVESVALLGTVTNHDDLMGYELSAGYKDFAAFVNGDENDMSQNIGGGVYKDIGGGTSFYAEAGYNFDTEETTPAAGISFAF